MHAIRRAALLRPLQTKRPQTILSRENNLSHINNVCVCVQQSHFMRATNYLSQEDLMEDFKWKQIPNVYTYRECVNGLT